MIKKDDRGLTDRQQRNMQYVEDRFELLDTIRDMVDMEIDRRCGPREGNPHPENPPPEAQGREPPEAEAGMPAGIPRRSLWQRIVRLFTFHLHQ